MIRRYWRVYRLFVSSSFLRELEFRENFVAKLAQNCVWIVFFSLLVLVVYRNTESLAGWNRGAAFVLTATVFLVEAVSRTLFNGLIEIPEQVRLGTLDFVVTKPIDSQFWVAMRRFNFDQLGSLLAAMGLMVYGVASSGASPGPVAWLLYLLLTAMAVVVYNAFMCVLMTLGIWLVRVDNLWVLGETVQQLARYPLEIFRTGVRSILTYAVPLAFVAYAPAVQLVKQPDFRLLGVGVVWAVVLSIVARNYWNFAMRHYSSASS